MMIIGLEELLDFEYQYNVSCMDKKTRAMHYFKKIFPLGDLCKKLKNLATQEYVVFGENALDTRCRIDSKPAICYFYYCPILDERCDGEFTKKEILTLLDDIVEQYIETNPEKEEDCRETLAEFQKKLNNGFQNEEQPNSSSL